MRTSAIALSILSLLSLTSAVGCGSDPATQEDFVKADGRGSGGPSSEPTADYAPGPYGYNINSVLPKLDFIGFTNPREAGFDTEKLQPISLADYYDPEGKKGSKLLFINITALWCGFCRAEHAASSYGPRAYSRTIEEEVRDREAAGLRFLELSIQGATGNPAVASDLAKWAEQFDFGLPLALDGDNKIQPAREGSGFPGNILVDTKTMRVIENFSSAAEENEFWSYVDHELETR